jgi:hypothetical protein
MSEETKKVEQIEQEAKQDVKGVKPTELSEQDLEKVAGGSSENIGGIDIVVRKKSPPPAAT